MDIINNKIVKKRPNIIWILTDSVRIYHTNADERGRLNIMDEFASDALDFRTAVTSAPSTIMSVSAMMTGVPSTYQSRDYISFKYEYDKLQSMPQVLRNNGYNTYGLLFWPDGRNFLGNIYGDICKDLWEKDFDKNKYWSNDDQLEIFDRFLDSDKINDDFFVWLHLNCRFDIELSTKVKILFQKLKDRGLYDDSIIVLNSDHGYPDPSRGISFYDKRKFGHDLIMSDDNILAPQLIKFPGVKPQRIEDPISTLDLAPTILHYLGFEDDLDFSKYPSHGLNLFDLLDNKDWSSRKVRVDNRFVFQFNKVTALRDHRFKYVLYEDEGREEFYDIEKDTYELHNLVENKYYEENLKAFRDEFKKQNDDIIAFHTEILDNQYKKVLNDEDVMLVGNFNENFFIIFRELLKRRNKVLKEIKIKNKKINPGIRIFTTNEDADNLMILAFPVSRYPRLNSDIVKTARSLKRKNNLLFLNYNFIKIAAPQHWFIYSMKKSKKWFRAFAYDPKTIILDFIIQFKRIIKNENK